MPIIVIACSVFQSLLQQAFPPAVVKGFHFLDYGLHRVSSNLTRTIQETIDAIPEPSLVVLGYGLCGNGLNGIQAGKHNLLIPRADDCIAILLGSYEKYQEEFHSEPGTYYLTKGWLESGSNPLSEFLEYQKKYGTRKAEFLIDSLYHNYHRLAFVAHDRADLDQYRPQAQEVARFCARWGMRYEEILGSTAYLARLVDLALASGHSDDGFLRIPPGGTLRQELFLRY